MSTVELKELVSEVKEMRKDFKLVFEVNETMNLPIALRKVLADTFRCCICQSTPIVPPVIFARCCKSIVGCQVCVDTLYCGEDGMTKKCPRCRAERAYAETSVLRGFDELLKVVEPLLHQPENLSEQ